MSNENPMSQLEDDLEEQLAMLGNDFNAPAVQPEAIPTPVTPAQPVQTAPSVSIPENPVGAPVVTSSVTPASQQVTTQPNGFATTAQTQPQPTQLVQQVVTPAQTIPAQVQPAQTVQAKPAQNIATEDDELLFIDLARAVHGSQTPFLKLKEDEWTRITLINLKQMIPMRLHYIDNIGWVKCHSTYNDAGWIETPAVCCKKITPDGKIADRLDEDGKVIKAKQRYLLPVIEYPVDKSNPNKLTGNEATVKIWNLNYVEMNALLQCVQSCAEDPNDLDSVNLSQLDLKLNKAKTGFKTISVSVANNCIRPQFENQIQQEISKLNKDFFLTALKESRKVVPVETIAQFYDSKEAIASSVDAAIAQQNVAGEGMMI